VQVNLATDQGAGLSNEDFVIAENGVVVVLDGVSQWYTTESGCYHGTVWYVQNLGTRLIRHASGTEPLRSAIGAAIADVAALHENTCDLAHPWSPAATVAVLRDGAEVEYAVLADCVVVLETAHGTEVHTDDRLARLGERAERLDADEELLRHARTGYHGLRNVPGGYWVASADPAAGDQAVTGSVPREALHRAALLTDGASCMVETYRATDWTGLLDLCASAGPAGAIEEVRKLERADPDGERWPRDKRHDDATVAFCRRR